MGVGDTLLDSVLKVIISWWRWEEVVRKEEVGQ